MLSDDLLAEKSADPYLKKPKARMNPETTRLIEAAETYKNYACEHLGGAPELPGTPDYLDSLDLISETLKANYLFPNLLPVERGLILCLRLKQRGLNLLINIHLENLNTVDAARHEKAVSIAETALMDMKSALEIAGTLESLTPIQKEVLEGEYLKIHFR